VTVLLYVAPIRDDVEIPYDLEEYARFKTEVERLSAAHGAIFLNLETLVPAAFWGMRKSERTGEDLEIDFMHFQGQGHRLLGEAIAEAVERWLAQSST
jgi:lysophospholipase L1-like esterase